MHLHDAWRLLGIPADSDVAAIKRAYAQKIRQYRPDEQPEMFAKVHTAYRQLLAHVRAKRQKVQNDEQPTVRSSWLHEPPDIENVQDVSTDRYLNLLPSSDFVADPATLQSRSESMPADAAPDEQAVHQNIAELLQRVERVLGQMPDLAQVQQWQFLAQPLLLDEATHWHLSSEVFLRIVQHHKSPSFYASAAVVRDPRRRPIRMPDTVLQYLDSLLLWQYQREALLNLPVGAEGQQVFNRLEYAPASDITKMLRGRAQVMRRYPERPPEPVAFESILGGLCFGGYLLYSFWNRF